MSKTRRLSYRLHDGEALVVGRASSFVGIIQVLDSLSGMDMYTPDEADVWRELRDWVQEWVDKTSQSLDDDYDA